MGWNSDEEFQIKMPEDKRNNVSTAVFRQPVFIMNNIIYASINEGGAVIAMKKIILYGHGEVMQAEC